MAFVVIDEARQQFDQQIDFGNINVIICLGQLPVAAKRAQGHSRVHALRQHHASVTRPFGSNAHNLNPQWLALFDAARSCSTEDNKLVQ
ncbi:hypothetical protein CGCTS75_v013616 [Colletotrichum tropicale]|nr:hypothetical protein CGCTS75_v013616 [Colletotrichum tropicale]